MKRNSLLAKSLTLGLAVATAAASMSVPGGLVAPVTAYAEEDVTAPTLKVEEPKDDNLKDTSATLSFTSDEDATVYYVVSDTELTTAEDVKNATGAQNVDVTANTKKEVEIPGLTANTEYKVYVTAEDAVGNACAVQTVTFTTEKTAMKGNASITAEGTADIAALKIGDTVKANYDGNDLENTNLAYKWSRVDSEGNVTEISGQTDATYILTADDLNYNIQVEISAKDASLSGPATATTTCTVAKKTPTATVSNIQYDSENSKITATTTNVTAASELEYSIDGGGNWTDGDGSTLKWENDTATLALTDGKAYAARAIQIRVKATADTEASEAAVYAEAITARLTGKVVINGMLKCGDTLTATASDTPASATLQYQFIRVSKDGKETPCGEASTTNTYILKKEDIGCTIRVDMTSEGYEGVVKSAATAEIQKAAARPVTAISFSFGDKTQDIKTKTWTYTIPALTGDDARYAYVEGNYTSVQAAKDDGKTVNWGTERAFSGLKTKTEYTFFATYADDGVHEESTPAVQAETTALLNHPDLTLNYTVEETADGGRTITITPVDGAEYTFDGSTYGSANTKTYTSDEVSSAPSVTIGIQYAEDPDFNLGTEKTETINLSTTQPQEAPSIEGLDASFTVNASVDKYKFDLITDPKNETAADLEYSVDGLTFGTSASLISAKEFGASETVTLYVRKKAGTGTFASPAVSKTFATPAASATPTISIKPSTEDQTTATITAGDGADIYYTTDGSAPTTASNQYSGAITINDGETIKAIAVENGKIMSAVASQTFTKQSSGGSDTGSGSGSGSGSSGGGSGSSSSGSGSTGTENKPETGTETKPNDTQVETSTGTNASGNTVEVTTTTKTDSTGAVTSIIEKSVIAESSSTTSTTVTVKKNGEGEITSATASIANTVESGNKATVSAALVSQITEAAGTDDVKITMTVKDADGSTKYKIKVDADNLQAGEDLYLYKLNTKTGEYVMVNAKTYGVSKSGSVSVSIKNKATYELVDAAQSARITKQIKSTIKPQKASASIKKNKKTTFALSKKANKSNVKSITYTTSKKSVATVSKSGKISAKGKGTAIVKAKVTLKNGATKTIKMTIKVK